jgi:hypothetical protein
MTLKFLSSILMILLPFISTYAQESKAPQFKFNESKIDFGEIFQGDIVEHSFEFTNIGDSPLVISKIITTCGCTAPTWPKNPIRPGEKGKIKIVFNSTGKIGRQNKVATILSNTSNQKDRLLIMANIIPKSGT